MKPKFVKNAQLDFHNMTAKTNDMLFLVLLDLALPEY